MRYDKNLVYLGVGVLLFVLVSALGVIFSDTMGYAARDSTVATVTEITVATNGTLTDLGSTYPFVQELGSCVNGTKSLASANYTVIEGNGDGAGGFVLLDTGASYSGEKVNCSVTYLKATTATTAANAIMLIFVTVASLFVIVLMYLILKPIIKGVE